MHQSIWQETLLPHFTPLSGNISTNTVIAGGGPAMKALERAEMPEVSHAG
ncbi:MAG: hypothetical protein FWE98_00015 [Oscillospiraceae bacterium]|nr:hypothetical protein [Oscillospiraceae bacterium]